MNNRIGIVILAAGLGKRMKSSKAKVLHEINGRTLIDYVVSAATPVVGDNVVVVVGHQAEEVMENLRPSHHVLFAVQPQQLGTGHAVLCALPTLPAGIEQVIVLCGDVPLIRTSTLQRVISEHLANERDVTVLAVEMADPTGYGRVIIDDLGNITGIVEQADANDSQKAIRIINTGIYAINRLLLDEALPKLCTNNAQNEIYLTDIVEYGYQHGRKMGVLIGSDYKEILGVNSQEDLRRVENIMKIAG
jgi:UDP-N-acetylglucosamine diphosphorylase/glucosamine-1-phosphate N-acetyltransferase